MQKSDIKKQEQEVLALLQDYPAPAPDEGFYERALVRATHEGSTRQRNRWMMTGFGAAIAATIAGAIALLVGALLVAAASAPAAGPSTSPSNRAPCAPAPSCRPGFPA